MERKENLLTAKEVAGAGPGWHADGNNLYLRVDHSPDGGKRRRWICRVTRDQKKRDFGCGSADRTSLALARKRRDAILAQLADGLDPVEVKREKREADTTAKKAAHTFGDAARAVFENRSPGWKKGSSTPGAWVKSINVDCKALLKLPVGEIGVHQVKSVVAPFWDRGNLVAGRGLLSRIELVLAYATAHEWRVGDNPASWSIFQHLFPHRQNGGKRHHPALDWKDTPAFIAKLRQSENSLSAVALELIALTACRSNEVRGMRWDEIDWDESLWTAPPERMKRSVEFKVPLSEQALRLLKPLYETRGRAQLVFPGPQPGKSIANQALWTMMQRATGKTATTHGLRASFRSWCEDVGVEHEVAEACLAHGKGDQTAQAYNRGEMVERRRVVMQRWGRFLNGEPEEGSTKVIPLARRKK
jgi:integrase